MFAVVGRKVKKLEVPAEVVERLAQGYKAGKSSIESRCCHILLLKLEGYTSKQIGKMMDCCEMSVNNWINGFIAYGMAGLQTKEGQGRKPILSSDDLPLVRKAVEAERQRLSQAKMMLEAQSGKRLSNKTLTRFLKVITAVTNE